MRIDRAWTNAIFTVMVERPDRIADRMAIIEAGAVLSGVIHWDGGKTGRGASAAGGIIGRGVHIHHGATIGDGAVIGDGTDVAAGAVVPTPTFPLCIMLNNPVPSLLEIFTA